jgi:uncharacterized RDD family membrane protein YckC
MSPAAHTDLIGRHRSDYAGLVSRLVALAVDAAVLGAAVALVGAGGPALWNTLTGHTPYWLRVCASVAAGAVPVLYFWLGWWVIGRSLGGLLLGYTVCRRDGAKLRMLRAAARSFVGLLLAPLWLAGMLLVLWDPRRRALHDVLFGTLVPRSLHDPVTAAHLVPVHPAHYPPDTGHAADARHPDPDHAADAATAGTSLKEAP